MVAWVANYLHFRSFGLYADDWFYVAFPFEVGNKAWILGSLVDVLTRLKGQGRPLQMIFGYGFAAAGPATDSLAVDYLISYALFAGSAILAYAVLRRRFSRFVACLAALIFVLTPLHTLHQFLNGQFTVGPAFLLVFGAILLYLRGRRFWAYLLAALSVLCYESMFFLFLGAPLLRRSSVLRQARREWIRHVAFGAALAGCYVVIRASVGESRVSGLSQGPAVAWAALWSWMFNSVASFSTYAHAVFRVRNASLEAWVYGVVFFGLVAAALLRFSRRKAAPVKRPAAARAALRSAWVGVVFVLLGYPLSYFFFQSAPRLYVTDRDTRVSIAASFGSSILVALALAACVRQGKTRAARAAGCAGASAFLTALFLYAFVVQEDYVEDWAEQREEARQILSSTPDVELDSLIVLKLRPPASTAQVFSDRRRGIGGEKYMFEQNFGWLCAGGRPWPTLMVVYSDGWRRHLKMDAEGFMAWTQPTFDGRWSPAAGRFKPGRFIVLDKREPDTIVRASEPVYVDGVQIVQLPHAWNQDDASLWSLTSRNRIAQLLLPAGVWAGAAHPADRNPRLVSPADGSVLTGSPVTFTWRGVRGAEDYWVDVGTGPGLHDIKGDFSKGKTEFTVDLSGRLTGETIHLQIYAVFPGVPIKPGSGAKFRFPTAAVRRKAARHRGRTGGAGPVDPSWASNPRLSESTRPVLP